MPEENEYYLGPALTEEQLKLLEAISCFEQTVDSFILLIRVSAQFQEKFPEVFKKGLESVREEIEHQLT